MPLRGLRPVAKPQWNSYTPEGTAACGGPTMEQVQTLKGLQPVESSQWSRYNP